MSEYLLNERRSALPIVRGATLPATQVLKAVTYAHTQFDKLSTFDFDIYAVLGMRNLSSFVGEVFAASLIHVTGDQFVKNPHQDGYPDLLLMDKGGKDEFTRLANRLRDKQPFSPFLTGGIEVKATCGSVPTPKDCFRRWGVDKPHIGDQRRDMLVSFDWKAHHRDTNHLMSLFWDFVDKRPTIVAVFYSDQLSESDWGEIIAPKKGGGRTTSVSIMTRPGVCKMCADWVLMMEDQKYQAFFTRSANWKP